MGVVADFLDRLAIEVQLQVDFGTRSQEVMAENGIDDPKVQDLIRYGSPGEVRQYLMEVEGIGNPHVYVLRMLPPIG
jgi:hypothetical protein